MVIKKIDFFIAITILYKIKYTTLLCHGFRQGNRNSNKPSQGATF